MQTYKLTWFAAKSSRNLLVTTFLRSAGFHTSMRNVVLVTDRIELFWNGKNSPSKITILWRMVCEEPIRVCSSILLMYFLHGCCVFDAFCDSLLNFWQLEGRYKRRDCINEQFIEMIGLLVKDLFNLLLLIKLITEVDFYLSIFVELFRDVTK